MQGTWKSGQNPNLIYIGDLRPGEYTLELQQGLPSRSGRSLERTRSGPAIVN